MSEPFLAEIVMFGGNFAPRGWALCNGQLLSIAQYSAVFSLLGTTYGGDGRTTFGLPDLRSRSPVHAGNGPGLPDIRLGAKGGNPNSTLPVHTHSMITALKLRASAEDNNSDDPSGGVLASGPNIYRSGSAPDTDMAANTVAGTVTAANAGTSATNANYHPYQAVNFIIALQGVFPSRN